MLEDGKGRTMRWVFVILVVLEIALVAMALGLIPTAGHANDAVFVVAINSILLIVVAKRLKKKPACCS